MPKVPTGWEADTGTHRLAKLSHSERFELLISDSRAKRRKAAEAKTPSVGARALQQIQTLSPMHLAALCLAVLLVGAVGFLTWKGVSPDTEGSPVAVASVPVADADQDSAPTGSFGPRARTGAGSRPALLPPAGAVDVPKAWHRSGVDFLPEVEAPSDSLVADLRRATSRTDERREEVIERMVDEAAEALPYLLAVFETGSNHLNPDPTLMETVVEILGKFDDPAARAAVWDAASSRLATVRHSALMALEDREDPKFIEFAIRSLGDESPEVRARANRILRNVGREGQRALVRGLAPVNWYDEKKILGIVRLLSGDPVKGSLGALVDLLEHDSPLVRKAALRSLGAWPGKSPRLRYRALPAIRVRLQDEDPYVQRQAAMTLMVLEDEDCVEDLMELLRASDHGVRKTARRALAKITGSDAGGSYYAWQKHMGEEHAD